ncbi:MAG: universal stress protein, partial [Pseudomonadota bacterium]
LRSIVAIHNGYEFEVSALATAVELAKAHRAHLRIVHAGYLTRPSAGYFGEAAAYGGGLQDVIEKHMRADLDRTRSSAQEICARHGLALSELASPSLPRAEFIPLEGVSNRRLIRDLSVTDLIVIGAKEGSAGWLEDSVANIALFSTGRPILVVRPLSDGAPAGINRGNACIAWSDAAEATHAVLNTRGLLATADTVNLINADGRADGDSSDDQRLALDYLHAHEINAKLDLVSKGNRGVAQAVLDRSRELGCDYLVMGAYGHSMFREKLIGGFSEHMLEQAEFPLVISH